MLQTKVDVSYANKTIRIYGTIDLEDLLSMLPTGSLAGYTIVIDNPIQVKLTTYTHNQD